jgi:hypothetical protein
MANKVWSLTDESEFKKWNENLDKERPVIGVYPDWRESSQEVNLTSL